jgi:phosphatidylserine/phosphatidylglycerophosphate/cardiolipin synthase-like enzyme
MPRIFISYRRADSRAITGRIHEHLTRAFGEQDVFMDVTDIPAGTDYKTFLSQQIESCTVALIVIGDQWLSLKDAQGRRRLDDPEDVVRHEVQATLERPSIRVIPVLVNNAPMPGPDELPEPLRPLHYRNAAQVRHDPDFEIDMERLIRQIGGQRRTGLLIGAAVAAVAILALAVILLLVLNGKSDKGDKTPPPTTAAAIQPTLTPTPQPSATPTQSQNTVYRVPQAGSEITLPETTKLYASPNTRAEILFTFNAGKRLVLVGQNKDGTWLYLKSAFDETQAGWATGDWITAYIQSPTPTPTPLPDIKSKISPDQTYITAGPVNGFWQVYFILPTNATDQTVIVQHQFLDTELVARIDHARSSLDIASYDLNLPSVTDAIIRASQRGLTVRVVADDEYGLNSSDTTFQQLEEAGIPVVTDQRQALMHHRFIIFDGRAVWTGKWAFTYDSTLNQNTAALVFDSPELAALYTAHFNALFERSEFRSGFPSAAHTVTVEGITIDSYFMPSDDALTPVKDILGQAKKSIYIMVMAFSLEDLGDELIAAVNQGVDVRVVTESRLSRLVEPWYCAGVPFRKDGNPDSLNHGVIVVDGELVISGSFNLSNNSFRENNEDLLIVHDPQMAQLFTEEFERVWMDGSDYAPGDIACPGTPTP